MDTAEPIRVIDVSAGSLNPAGPANQAMAFPTALGEGTIQRFNLSASLFVLIHQYTLSGDVLLRRPAEPGAGTIITFSFRNVFGQTNQPAGGLPVAKPTRPLPSVQLSSSDIDLEFLFPAGTSINTIIIGIELASLRQLLHQQADNPLIQTVLGNRRSYLYEELGSPAVQQLAADIVSTNGADPLRTFYLTIKAQELMYQFFRELLKRETAVVYPLRGADVKTLLTVQARIVADLSQPPSLPQLARFSGMSESKLQRLFRQVFGMSLYDYYQTVRMHEAARLLREAKLSVSETGYQLGFTNLSHFTRVFEKYLGQKPKRYAKTPTSDSATESVRP